MNAQTMAKTAYSSAQTPVRTPRGIEYEAFARATHRLQSAAHNMTVAKGKAPFGPLALAIHENRRLWTLLAADVAASDNALPDELRARIFYLAEFTQHHSRKVLTGEAEASVLVEINTAIMRGLRGQEATA